MQEKLDRDSGSTIGVTLPGSDELEEHKPVDAFAILAEMKKQEALKNPLFEGPYATLTKGTRDYDMGMFNHKRKKEKSLGLEGEIEAWVTQDPALVLTEEDEREIMAEYLALTAKPASVAAVEVSPLVNVASEPEPEDFWGEEEDDGYAKIKRKAQSRI